MKDDLNEWLRKLVGDKHVIIKEESCALPSYCYSKDPADNLDRIRAGRKAAELRKAKYKKGYK